MASNTRRTFHPFPRLPAELRVKIWQLVLRRLEPCVHYFTTLQHESRYWVPNGLAPALDPTARLSAPVLAIHTGDDNPSIYMRDWGLWTACAESHAEIKRARAGLEAGDKWKLADIKLNFRRNVGRLGIVEPYHFAHFLTTDLMCFELSDLSRLQSCDTVNGRGMAVPYCPSWSDLFAEADPAEPYCYRRTLEGFLFRAGHLLAGTMYFIDRGMRPLANNFRKSTGDKRQYGCGQISFQAEGYELVVVDEDNANRWDFRGSSSLQFVNRFREATLAWRTALFYKSRSRDAHHVWATPSGLALLGCAPDSACKIEEKRREK
ncbi:hypothetical protein SPI_05471 [Niveomyces insectorum RCEF 264]|uniref:2EXR domain-containing protein n=1 Tax=Niveomyces insectorum RCEF 264 TaxID=1081102 RepID=A0A167T955_9HYPO|nr:hypothetical protein SPI_05471 [Niveomyces insectorum RCEF 264]